MFIRFVCFVCFVCFAKFFYFFCNIKKSKNLIFNNFRINRRVNAFEFFDYDIQNQFKIDMKNAIVNRLFIFSFISSYTSIRKYQKFHIQKFYLIMNDLHRIFYKKFESFNLRQYYNRRFFQQNFDIRQFFSIKFHFNIDNLIRMFHKKFKSFDLRQHYNYCFFFRKTSTFDYRLHINFVLRFIFYLQSIKKY